MNEPLIEIIDLAQGLSGVKFGAARDQVRQLLGEPDEVEFIDPEYKEDAEFWYYRQLKMNILFSKFPMDGVLSVSSFMTGSLSAELWGTRVIGLEKAALLEFFAAHGYQGFVDVPDTLASSGYETLEFEPDRITLDLYKGMLKRIQWGVVKEEKS